MVGSACCSSVRAAIGVSRCSRASPAHSSATRPSEASIGSSARRATSTAAVSITSWLVAPRCTCCAASPPTASRSADTSGAAGLAYDRPAADSASRSKSEAEHASPIASAASAGITPARACARASADSKSSIAWYQAASPVASRTAGGTNRGSNCKEGGLAVALQADVEP